MVRESGEDGTLDLLWDRDYDVSEQAAGFRLDAQITKCPYPRPMGIMLVKPAPTGPEVGCMLQRGAAAIHFGRRHRAMMVWVSRARLVAHSE